MTFIVKFLTKGVLVIALEVSDIISDVAPFNFTIKNRLSGSVTS